MDDPNGLDLIAFERRRQIANGYDSVHDDEHSDGAIVRNANSIMLAVSEGEFGGYADEWGIVEKHGYDNPVKLLTIAGALIAAEIDRLLREARRTLTSQSGETE